MFIIPIGTKSTLALKPKVTIGLIIANIIIAIFTFPMMKQTEKKLISVQRHRYANQVRLYIADHRPDNEYNHYLDGYIEGSIKKIEESTDYIDLEISIMEALSLAGATFEDLEKYEEELAERTELYYDSNANSALVFEEWKQLKAKEDKVLLGNVNFAFGLIPQRMERVHTFVTHLFLHGGIWHLLGNMLFLWVVGCLMEDSWGRVPFLVFYIIGGAFAGLAHCLQDTSSSIPLIGASGAIAAAMGAFTVRHFWTRIKFFYFFVFFFRPFWGTFHLPAFVFLPFWFIEQIALKSLADFMGGSDVAYLAHIAGYTFGAMAALTVRATDFEKRYLAPKLQQKQVEAGVLKDPRFNKACELMDSGSVERAKALFDQLISARPDDFNTLQDIASIYKEKGLNKDYCELAGNILKNLLLKSRFDEASSLALGIASHKEPVDINPQLLMRVGKWLTEQRRHGEAHDIYRSIISGNSSMHVSVKASLALAKLLYGRMDNPRDALSVIVDARDLVPDAEWAERLSEMENTIKEMHPEFSKV